MKYSLNYDEFLEARIQGSPDVKYDQEIKKKTGEIEKLIVQLSGETGKQVDELSSQYKKLDEEIKNLSEQRSSLNEDIKTYCSALFDTEDKICTRVVDSINFSMTLSAEKDKSSSSTDYEKVINELLKTNPKLFNIIDDLKKQYTEVSKTVTPERLSNIKQKNENEEIDESIKDIIGWLKNTINKFISSIKSKFNDYDKSIEKIKKEAKIRI